MYLLLVEVGQRYDRNHVMGPNLGPVENLALAVFLTMVSPNPVFGEYFVTHGTSFWRFDEIGRPPTIIVVVDIIPLIPLCPKHLIPPKTL